MIKKFYLPLCMLFFVGASLNAVSDQTISYAKWGAAIGAVPGLVFLFTPSKYLKEESRNISFAQKLTLFGSFEATVVAISIGVGHGSACLNRTFGLTAFAHAAFQRLNF